MEALQALALLLTVLGMGLWIRALPDREELGPRLAELRFEQVELDHAAFGPIKVVGAWQVVSDDSRVGGVSGLTLRDGRLTALTDSGVLIRFRLPIRARMSAFVDELPDGPGPPNFKKWRDSEALLADPHGRGWWVAFENHHSLWLYDRSFRRPLGAIRFPEGQWKRNRGIEGLASHGAALLLFSEDGQASTRVQGRSARKVVLDRPSGRISEAATLGSGRLAVIHRSLTPLGFTNRLSIFEPASGNRLRLHDSYLLGFSALDNVEAMAPEQLPGGTTRLWLMTDDNFQRPLRTLLVAVDLP